MEHLIYDPTDDTQTYVVVRILDSSAFFFSDWVADMDEQFPFNFEPVQEYVDIDDYLSINPEFILLLSLPTITYDILKSDYPELLI